MKLFAGILECILRKGFHQKLKQPSPLEIKGYIIYIIVIILETGAMSINILCVEPIMYN